MRELQTIHVGHRLEAHQASSISISNATPPLAFRENWPVAAVQWSCWLGASRGAPPGWARQSPEQHCATRNHNVDDIRYLAPELRQPPKAAPLCSPPLPSSSTSLRHLSRSTDLRSRYYRHLRSSTKPSRLATIWHGDGRRSTK